MPLAKFYAQALIYVRIIIGYYFETWLHICIAIVVDGGKMAAFLSR